MIVFIQLTTVGANAGPFNLFSDVDSYAVPFASSVNAATLLAGANYSIAGSPTQIQVVSQGVCTNSIFLVIDTTTTTTTSTTSTTSTSTSSTTTTTTTTPLFALHLARVGGSPETVCADPEINVYTIYGETLHTGVYVYYDSALTLPVTDDAIVLTSTAIYNMDGLGLITTYYGECP